MSRPEERCPKCGREPGGRGYCRNCGALLWFWIVSGLLGGFACVALGFETAYRAVYPFEPVIGGVVAFIGLLEWGWVGAQILAARRLRKKLRPPGPSGG